MWDCKLQDLGNNNNRAWESCHAVATIRTIYTCDRDTIVYYKSTESSSSFLIITVITNMQRLVIATTLLSWHVSFVHATDCTVPSQSDFTAWSMTSGGCTPGDTISAPATCSFTCIVDADQLYAQINATCNDDGEFTFKITSENEESVDLLSTDLPTWCNNASDVTPGVACANSPCQHGAICAETHDDNGNDFTCTCSGGWTGN